jgi:hypothetical protein
VHVGAKANIRYPRSCIVQDALFGVSEKLGAVRVSFETESQYTFLYRHSTDFEILFPAVSHNPLSCQSTVPTQVTLCLQSLDIVTQFQWIGFVSVQTTALPVNGVPDRRFRMNAVTAIVFFW